MQKIALRLSPTVVRRARAAVARGRAPSLSAYVAAALEEKTKLDELEDLLTEMLAESGGRLTAGERNNADKALRGRRRRRQA